MSGIFQRIRRIIVARWRDLSHRGDEKVIQHTLENFEASYAEAQAEIARCQAEIARSLLMEAEEMHTAEQALALARDALRSGNDQLAREAVARHLTAQRQAEYHHQICDRYEDMIRQLQPLAEALAEKRIDMEFRQHFLQIRRQSAELSRKFTEELDVEREHSTIHRAEEQMLMDMQTHEAYHELTHDTLIEKIDALDHPHDPHTIDGLLTKLRREMEAPD